MNTYDHATVAASWSDFNDAEAQQGGFDLIPRGIAVPVRMTIKPGGHDDHTQGWTGGYATQSFDTGAVYLACEFVVTDGPFAKRKMWSNVGLYSPKGPTWGQMGRSFIRAALNSARNVHPQDNSPQAAAARRTGPCAPEGRSEMTYHPANTGAGFAVAMPQLRTAPWTTSPHEDPARTRRLLPGHAAGRGDGHPLRRLGRPRAAAAGAAAMGAGPYDICCGNMA